MFAGKVSVIEGKHQDNRIDELYQPLRKTLLTDTSARKQYLEEATTVSHLSSIAKPLSISENYKIGETTLILQDSKLRPSSDLTKIPKNRIMAIVNAEKKVRDPISQQQLRIRLSNSKNKDEIIVYTLDDQVYNFNPKPQTPSAPEKLEKAKRKNSGVKVTQAKYNLFSVIDEPINNLLSGKACTCPANQIIAQKKTQIMWGGVNAHPN